TLRPHPTSNRTASILTCLENTQYLTLSLHDALPIYRVVQHPVREAPFIVVPGHDFHVTANDPGMVGVKDAGQGIVVEINADQFLNIVAQYRVVICRGFAVLFYLLNSDVYSGDKA